MRFLEGELREEHGADIRIPLDEPAEVLFATASSEILGRPENLMPAKNVEITGTFHVLLIGLAPGQAVLLTPVVVMSIYLVGFVFLLLQDRSLRGRLILLAGFTALALSGINMYYKGRFCLVAALSGHVAFLVLLIGFMLGRLFREKRVTVDTIMAGVIVYLLMAGLWTQFYALTLLADPAALHSAGGLGGRPYVTLYYFSVTTLTTAGFGDLTPVSDLARILAAYESLVGQVYLVVFISLLLGRHFAETDR